MKFTTHNGEPRTVIHVSLMLIFTTNIVCSHRDGVLKDCVKLEVSQRRLAWRVGVGGRGLLVLSVGGGVRERGRCCAGIFSCLCCRAGVSPPRNGLAFFGLALVWRNRSARAAKMAALRAASYRLRR